MSYMNRVMDNEFNFCENVFPNTTHCSFKVCQFECILIDFKQTPCFNSSSTVQKIQMETHRKTLVKVKTLSVFVVFMFVEYLPFNISTQSQSTVRYK